MTFRTLLRRQLRKAWCETMNAYRSQLVNSEAGLQLFFCKSLLDQFSLSGVTKNRRLFVQPCVFVDGAVDRKYPDVVICNSRQIIGVAELKYVPRGRPDHTKDMQTLEFMAAHADRLTLSNDRFCGPSSPRSYSLARDAVLCWAGIYKGKKLVELNALAASFNDRFLRLDALTRETKPPEVSIDGKIC